MLDHNTNKPLNSCTFIKFYSQNQKSEAYPPSIIIVKKTQYRLEYAEYHPGPCNSDATFKASYTCLF